MPAARPCERITRGNIGFPSTNSSEPLIVTCRGAAGQLLCLELRSLIFDRRRRRYRLHFTAARHQAHHIQIVDQHRRLSRPAVNVQQHLIDVRLARLDVRPDLRRSTRTCRLSNCGMSTMRSCCHDPTDE